MKWYYKFLAYSMLRVPQGLIQISVIEALEITALRLSLHGPFERASGTADLYIAFILLPAIQTNSCNIQCMSVCCYMFFLFKSLNKGSDDAITHVDKTMTVFTVKPMFM